MNVTVFGAGSRGDIQPLIALVRGLRAAGYNACLAAPEDFRPLAAVYGAPFRPLSGDVQQIMESDTARAFMQSGGTNPLRSIRAMRALTAPVILQMAQDAYDACLDADALICLGVFSAFGQSIAQKLNIPILHIEPTPLLPTRAFPAPSWLIQRNLGGMHNGLSGRVMLHVIWSWYNTAVNAFRRQIGMEFLSATRFYRAFRSTPMLGAYSPRIIPHPPDYPENHEAVGYLFLDDAGDWQPPAELMAFLEAGDPPVYVGFGSMAGRNPQETTALVIDALARSGQRGVLAAGWGGLEAADLPESVFALNAAPHDWLFPRMAAVVHHGGAGTTAAGLRAGKPSVIIPFAFDQPFWGARIQALGLGTRPIARKTLAANRLTEAIRMAVTDKEMRWRAQVCGETIRAEQGIENAMGFVRRFLGDP